VGVEAQGREYGPRSVELENIRLDRADGILTITLDQPARKNALTRRMFLDLRDVFRDLIANPDDTRVVVVTGAEGEFCSGADLAATGDATIALHQLAWMRQVGECCAAFHALPQPVIAKVVGVAAGAGANLAFGSDLIVAAENARFSEIFARRGLSIDFGGSWVLPRLVGLHRAKELAFFADIISAADAAEMGLVNRVVPVDEIDAFVDDWAHRLAEGPPIALSMTKKLLDASYAATIEQALENEAMAQTVNFGTADTLEAMTAFLEKRAPAFRGR
jgi:enoyl-CoA hydratase/carnithine racemase